jgi:hypothetical protein
MTAESFWLGRLTVGRQGVRYWLPTIAAPAKNTAIFTPAAQTDPLWGFPFVAYGFVRVKPLLLRREISSAVPCRAILRAAVIASYSINPIGVVSTSG